MGRNNQLKIDLMELLSEDIQSASTIYDKFENNSKFNHRAKQTIRDSLSSLCDQGLIDLVWEKNVRGKYEKYYALATEGAKWHIEHKKQKPEQIWEMLFASSDSKYSKRYKTKINLRRKNRFELEENQYLLYTPQKRKNGFDVRAVLEHYENQLNLEPDLFFSDSIKHMLNNFERSEVIKKFADVINGQETNDLARVFGISTKLQKSRTKLSKENIVSTLLDILILVSEKDESTVKEINEKTKLSKRDVEKIIHSCNVNGLLVSYWGKRGRRFKLSIFGLLLLFWFIENYLSDRFFEKIAKKEKEINDVIFQVINNKKNTLPRIFNNWHILRKMTSDLGLLSTITSQFFTPDRRLFLQNRRPELDLIQTIKTLEPSYEEKFKELLHSGMLHCKKWEKRNLKHLTVVMSRVEDTKSGLTQLHGEKLMKLSLKNQFKTEEGLKSFFKTHYSGEYYLSPFLGTLFDKIDVEKIMMEEVSKYTTNLDERIVRKIQKNSYGDKKFEILLSRLVEWFIKSYQINPEFNRSSNKTKPDFETIINYINDVAKIIRHRTVLEEIIYLQKLFDQSLFGDMDIMLNSHSEKLTRMLSPLQNLISFQFYSGLHALNTSVWKRIMELDPDLLNWYQKMVSKIIQTEEIIYEKHASYQEQIQEMISMKKGS